MGMSMLDILIADVLKGWVLIYVKMVHTIVEGLFRTKQMVKNGEYYSQNLKYRGEFRNNTFHGNGQ